MSSRRRRSPETKLQVVKEALEIGKVSVSARRYELDQTLYQWVQASTRIPDEL